MFKNLSIQNFQSHKDTNMEFHKGVNVIIGSSDSGKSAIIRALRWCVNNKPNGAEFQSHWDKHTYVTLTLDTDTVKRIKAEDKNNYKLDGSEFKALGGKVPEEIQSVLNINDINIQHQLDAPYLLSESAGAVAKHFNKVARLDKIDEATLNIKKAINTIDTSIKVKTEKLSSYQEAIEQMPNVEQMDLDVEELEQLEKKRIAVTGDITQLTALVKDIRRVRNELKEFQELLEHENSVNEILGLIQQRDSKENDILSLGFIIRDIDLIDYKIQEKEKLLQCVDEVNSIQEKITARNEKQARVTVLNRLLSNIANVERKLLKTQENALEMEKKFHIFLPEICPLCGNETKKVKNGNSSFN
jgi:chromosome segregation ATPase